MSAHNQSQEELLADKVLIDPGPGKKVVPDRSPAVLLVKTAGPESRILGKPLSVGQELTIALNIDGGDLTVTQSGSAAFNAAGNTTVTLDTVGDRVTFVSTKINNVLTWRVSSGDGHAMS